MFHIQYYLLYAFIPVNLMRTFQFVFDFIESVKEICSSSEAPKKIFPLLFLCSSMDRRKKECLILKLLTRARSSDEIKVIIIIVFFCSFYIFALLFWNGVCILLFFLGFPNLGSGITGVGGNFHVDGDRKRRQQEIKDQLGQSLFVFSKTSGIIVELQFIVWQDFLFYLKQYDE